MMRKILILIVLVPLFYNSLDASVIPDSLVQKLNKVAGEERLEVWRWWLGEINATNKESRLSGVEEACKEAFNILDSEEAILWCYERKVRLARNLRMQGGGQEAYDLFIHYKSYADSLANINEGKHETLALWHFWFGVINQRDDDDEAAIESFNKAMAIYHHLGNRSHDFDLNRYLAISLESVNRDKEAFEHFYRADSIADVDSTVSLYSKTLLKNNIAYFRSNIWELEGALEYYEQVIPNLDQFNKDYGDRIMINYLDTKSSIGQTDEAIKGLAKLNSEINYDNYNLMAHFTGIYSACLVRAGKTADAGEMNTKHTDYIWKIANKSREDEVFKWQIKYQSKEKEAKIKSLVLEGEKEKARFNLRLTILIALSLLALGILSFLLYRNKNRRQQEELQRQRDMEVIKNRDRLFSSITHDIRTPLALMMAPLERAEGKIVDTQIKSDINLAQRNGKRLMELFNQILDWNKAESNAMQLNNQVGQLDISLEALCSRFVQQASEENIIFKYNLELPKGQFALDYDKLDKILSNLVGNAIKFCENGEFVHLNAKLQQIGDAYQIEVDIIDNGPGITKTDQDNLFTRFYQGKQGKIHGGTGIGLALVKELVALMKGDIRLESEEQKGTSFFVHLPIQKVADMEISKIEEVGEEKFMQKAKGEKPFVLVVEDEPELLEFLHSALSDRYKVERAGSANVGKSIAISQIPDIIISDWTLPDNNGGWLCQQIRQNPLTSHIPIIILTAHSTDSHQQEAFRSGAIAWMAKPFKLETLQRQIKTILDQQVRSQLLWSKNQGSGILGIDNETESAPIDPFLNEVIQHIQKNMGDEFYSVEKLASQMNLSRTQLFRKVKNVTGASPVKLLIHHRLEKARELLKQSTQTISEIAFEVGFSDPNYFSRVYKKHFSVAPSEDQR